MKILFAVFISRQLRPGSGDPWHPKQQFLVPVLETAYLQALSVFSVKFPPAKEAMTQQASAAGRPLHDMAAARPGVFFFQPGNTCDFMWQDR
jgi:hypothetical protein